MGECCGHYGHGQKQTAPCLNLDAAKNCVAFVRAWNSWSLRFVSDMKIVVGQLETGFEKLAECNHYLSTKEKNLDQPFART